jgi:hypothetical protein
VFVDDELESLQPLVNPGERLVWSGRPDPRLTFTRADFFLIPLHLVATAIILYFIASALHGADSRALVIALQIIGWAVTAIGLFFLIGRFFVKASGKRRTVYGLTDKNAMELKGRHIRYAELADAPGVVTMSRGGSHASVRFGDIDVPVTVGVDVSRMNFAIGNAGLDFLDLGGNLPIAFYDVADVDGLLAALKDEDGMRAEKR